MIKKIVLLFLFVFAFDFNLSADWKEEILRYFGNTNDYERAVEYLINHSSDTDNIPKPVAAGLLAYSFHKLNVKNKEFKWLINYFENYRVKETIFSFLDSSTYEDIKDYLVTWENKYPLVTEMAFIWKAGDRLSILPSKLIIGIDIKNDAYYKLSEGRNCIQGGLLKKGFNTFSISATRLFEKSGSYDYFLDLKAGDMIMRKKIEVDSKIDLPADLRESESVIINKEYKVSLYVGGRLVACAKKSPENNLPLKFELPHLPESYDPFDPKIQENPFSNSFSILGVLAGMYQLVRELKKEKAEERKSPSFQRKQQISFTFNKKDSDGIEKEVMVVIQLKSRNLGFINIDIE